MSYDLIFARLAPDQRWADYLAVEHDSDNDDADRAVNAETWQRIVRRVREVLPQVEEAGDELDDERTGIQVFCGADEATVQAPYWHTGAEAGHVVAVMYRIAAIIAEETGFQGYDQQIEVPTAEVGDRLDAAVAVFDNVAASFARRGIRTA